MVRLRNDRRSERREEAKERQAFWSGLSVSERVKALDLRLGVGVGAKRQRKKLEKSKDFQGKP